MRGTDKRAGELFSYVAWSSGFVPTISCEQSARL